VGISTVILRAVSMMPVLYRIQYQHVTWYRLGRNAPERRKSQPAAPILSRSLQTTGIALNNTHKCEMFTH
jgi:hypothetical protein